MARHGWPTTLTATIALAMSMGIGVAGAQTTPSGDAAANDIEADPIRCWWRTSASAVRVGEAFTLVLTCAIVDNETTTVVPEHSRLDPAAMQLPPFEVVGGQRGPDLVGDQRRFFQYQYRLRLINEELFGKDARVPSLQMTYHLESHVERGESVRGRDRIYLLPTESVRVLSLVPSDATDIRDTPSWTFEEIETQRFRARVLFVIGGVLFAAAAAAVFVALVRLVRQYREDGTPGHRLLSDGAILGGVGRELARVRRLSEGEGWSHELAGRAAAALRIAGSLALGRPVGQSTTSGSHHEGQLLMRGGLLRGKKVWVSGSATANTLVQELASADAGSSAGRRECLEKLQAALLQFTATQFGRDEKLDGAALGEALAETSGSLRYLKIQNLWVVRRFRDATEFAAELGNRAWSR